MCGRFTQHHTQGDVATRFAVQQTLFTATPRYNIAPTQTVAVVLADSAHKERLLEGFQWGLIPSWAKDTSIASKLINARAETVAEKPSFRQPLKTNRCIVPADGFYEWDKEGGTKQPFHFRLKDEQIFGLAGLWAEWKDPDGVPMHTFTLITTEANELVGRIHDRMPVILQSPEDEALWLDDTVRRSELVLPLLRPYPAEKMEAIAVSKRVNSVKYDDATLVDPATA